MSLRKCKECGQQISSDAKVCPHCGKKSGSSTAAVGCLTIIILLGVLAILGFLSQQPISPPATHPSTKAEQEAQAKAVANQAAQEKKWLASKAGRIWQKHKGWERGACESIAQRKVLIGMTAEQVIAAWGRPEQVNRTVFSGSTHEQWVYGDTYLYFEDGAMTSFQDSRD